LAQQNLLIYREYFNRNCKEVAHLLGGAMNWQLRLNSYFQNHCFVQNLIYYFKLAGKE